MERNKMELREFRVSVNEYTVDDFHTSDPADQPNLSGAPVLALNTGASVVEKSTTPITRDMLLTIPRRGKAYQTLTYTLTSGPSQGVVGTVSGDAFADEKAITAVTTFTQSQVDDGAIMYQHTGAVGSDAFEYTVSDGTSTPLIGTFSIVISAADAPLAPLPSTGMSASPEDQCAEANARRQADLADLASKLVDQRHVKVIEQSFTVDDRPFLWVVVAGR
jgi:hypothetical protein